MADIIIKRVGGKSKLASWIGSLLPYHTIYCEPFGGSFAVGFSLPKATGSGYRLVYNDLDHHVSNFFRVLRDHSEELARQINFTPYSRSEFQSACNFINNTEDLSSVNPVEWARNYLIFNRQSIFGKETGTWCIARKGENSCITWANLPAIIINFATRLKETYIECDDFKNVIKRWDSEETCLYIDPPYLHVEADFYHVNKKDGFCHKTMASFLKTVQSSWAISYYDSPEIRDLYSGYQFFTREVKKHMQIGKKDSAIEVLIVHSNNWSKSNSDGQCFVEENCS